MATTSKPAVSRLAGGSLLLLALGALLHGQPARAQIFLHTATRTPTPNTGQPTNAPTRSPTPPLLTPTRTPTPTPPPPTWTPTRTPTPPPAATSTPTRTPTPQSTPSGAAAARYLNITPCRLLDTRG